MSEYTEVELPFLQQLTVIDYVVVHELCHLHQRDHTDAFWNEVDKVLPQYRERKQ